MTAINSLCVYCGSQVGNSPGHAEAAHRLGVMMAERDIVLVYGGGKIGVMGILADAVIDAGGRVIGIIPNHLQDSEVGHPGVSELLIVDSMHTRKRKMFELSDGFVTLPGGLGTLDETFEIITWKQLGLHDKPIIIVDVDGYWRPLLDLVQGIIANGYARPGVVDLFEVVPSVEGVFEALEAIPAPRIAARPERI